MSVPFLDLKAQYQAIGQEVMEAIQQVIDKNAFIQGEQVEQLEHEFSAFCEVKHAIGAGSGTAALHLALLACGVGQGDAVVTTPHTFIATAEAISHTGAVPVFVDADPQSYNLDVVKLEKFLARTDKPVKAIIPVHLYGQPVDMQPVMELARRYKLFVIEDCAQAHGARYNGRRVGSFGHFGAFSFFPGKNLGAYGDGGMLVTNDDILARKARLLADHGREEKYRHLIVGYNYRLDGLQAAILRVKLPHLEHWNSLRRQHAAEYSRLLAHSPVMLPQALTLAEHVYHLYVIRTARRDDLRNHLNKLNIGTGIHYPIPLHLQPAYAFLGYKPGDFPVTEKLAGEILSLPMYPELKTEDIQQVVQTLLEFLSFSPTF